LNIGEILKESTIKNGHISSIAKSSTKYSPYDERNLIDLNPFFNHNRNSGNLLSSKIFEKIEQIQQHSNSQNFENLGNLQLELEKKISNPYLSPEDNMSNQVYQQVVGNITKMCQSMPVLLRGAQVDEIAEFGQSSPLAQNELGLSNQSKMSGHSSHHQSDIQISKQNLNFRSPDVLEKIYDFQATEDRKLSIIQESCVTDG
jgi:hypothetical protein